VDLSEKMFSRSWHVNIFFRFGIDGFQRLQSEYLTLEILQYQDLVEQSKQLKIVVWEGLELCDELISMLD